MDLIGRTVRTRRNRATMGRNIGYRRAKRRKRSEPHCVTKQLIASAPRTQSPRRTNLFATASHELRTPITAIIGWAAAALRKARRALLARAIETAKAHGSDRSGEILPLSSSRAARIEPRPVAWPLRSAPRSTLSPCCEPKNITLSWVDPDAHTYGMRSGSNNSWKLATIRSSSHAKRETVAVGSARDDTELTVTTRHRHRFEFLSSFRSLRQPRSRRDVLVSRSDWLGSPLVRRRGDGPWPARAPVGATFKFAFPPGRCRPRGAVRPLVWHRETDCGNHLRCNWWSSQTPHPRAFGMSTQCRGRRHAGLKTARIFDNERTMHTILVSDVAAELGGVFTLAQSAGDGHRGGEPPAIALTHTHASRSRARAAAGFDSTPKTVEWTRFSRRGTLSSRHEKR